MKLGILVATRKGFTAPPQIDYTRYNDTVNLSHNPIATLEFLPTLTDFRALIFDDTKLESLLKAVPQPEIEQFSCINAPLAANKFLPIMAVIAFGTNLKVVNGTKITPKIIKDAQTLQVDLYPYIIEGWVIASLSPLKLINPLTKEKKFIKLEREPQANNQIEIVYDPNDNTELENEKQEKINKALRYRFNDLVHPPTKQKSPTKTPRSPTKSGIKSRGFASTTTSYRQVAREKSQNTKVTVKPNDSPFEKKQ